MMPAYALLQGWIGIGYLPSMLPDIAPCDNVREQSVHKLALIGRLFEYVRFNQQLT